VALGVRSSELEDRVDSPDLHRAPCNHSSTWAHDAYLVTKERLLPTPANRMCCRTRRLLCEWRACSRTEPGSRRLGKRVRIRSRDPDASFSCSDVYPQIRQVFRVRPRALPRSRRGTRKQCDGCSARWWARGVRGISSDRSTQDISCIRRRHRRCGRVRFLLLWGLYGLVPGPCSRLHSQGWHARTTTHEERARYAQRRAEALIRAGCICPASRARSPLDAGRG
jgi:hypothetical protein